MIAQRVENSLNGLTGDEIATSAEEYPLGKSAIAMIGPPVAHWLSQQTGQDWTFSAWAPETDTESERPHRLEGPGGLTCRLEAQYPPGRATPPFEKPWRLTVDGAMPDGTNGPSITMAADKNPLVIAKDIQRRLLPKYQEQFAGTVHAQQQQHLALEQRDALVSDLVAGLGAGARVSKSPRFDTAPDSMAIDWTPDGSRFSRTHVEFRVPPGAGEVQAHIRGLDPLAAQQLALGLRTLVQPAAPMAARAELELSQGFTAATDRRPGGNASPGHGGRGR